LSLLVGRMLGLLVILAAVASADVSEHMTLPEDDSRLLGEAAVAPLMMWGRNAKFGMNGEKPLLADAVGTVSKAVAPVESDAEQTEVDALKGQVADLQEEARQLKLALANSVVFEEKAKELEKSLESKEQESAIHETEVEGKGALRDQRQALERKIDAQTSSLEAAEKQAQGEIGQKEVDLASMAKKTKALQAQLHSEQDKIAKREAADKASLRQLQAQADETHVELSKMNNENPVQAAKLHELQEEGRQLEAKEISAAIKTKQEQETASAVEEAEKRKQEELESVNTKLRKVQDETSDSELELSKLKGLAAGAEEEASMNSAEAKNVKMLQATLDEQQGKETEMETKLAAAAEAEENAEEQLQEKLNTAQNDARGEDQQITQKQRDLKAKLAFMQQQRERQVTTLAHNAKLKEQEIQQEIARMQKLHDASMVMLQKQVQEQHQRARHAKGDDLKDLDAKLKAEWSAKIAAAAKEGRGESAAHDKIETVLRDAQTFVNQTKKTEAKVQKETTAKVNQVNEESTAAISEIKQECARKTALLANRTEMQIQQQSTLTEQYKDEIAEEEQKLVSAGSTAQQHEQDEVVQATKQEQAAVDEAVHEAWEFAATKASAEEQAVQDAESKLDQEIANAKALKQQAQEEIAKYRKKAKDAKDSTEAERDNVRSLKKDLESVTRTLQKANYNVSYPTAMAKQLQQLNSKVQMSAEKDNSSALLLDARIAEFQKATETTKTEIEKQQGLEAALENHVLLLAKQLEAAKEGHMTALQQRELAESAAMLADSRAAAAQGSKEATLRLLNKQTFEPSAEDSSAAEDPDTTESLLEDSEGSVAPEDTKAQEAMSRMSDCAKQCYHARGAEQPACMHECMSAIELGETTSSESEHPSAVGEETDQKEDTKEQERIKEIAKHCEYSEAAWDLRSRRAELKELNRLNMEEWEAQSLLQVDAQAQKKDMWFVQKYSKDGKRNARGYDNTSLECACVRNCEADHKCIKNCIWRK